MPKDEHGIVGANKNADRQIIVWITNAILQAIQNDTNTGDLSNLTIHSSEQIQGYSMKNACEVWDNVPLSVICEKFKKAYNRKLLFSKSKKYVLPYFVAVENILSNKKTEELPALLDAFAKSCKEISSSKISNKKALFSASEIKGNGTSKFKSAMDKLIGECGKIQQQLQLEEGRRECRRRFKLLVQKLLTDLEEYYSWSVFDDLKGRLNELVECFENAYLSGGTLTVTHPEYTLKPEKGSYLLTAYPVLHALSKKANTDNINDAVIDQIRTFMDDAYNKLNDEAQLQHMPTNEDGSRFDIDIAEVMSVLYK